MGGHKGCARRVAGGVVRKRHDRAHNVQSEEDVGESSASWCAPHAPLPTPRPPACTHTLPPRRGHGRRVFHVVLAVHELFPPPGAASSSQRLPPCGSGQWAAFLLVLTPLSPGTDEHWGPGWGATSALGVWLAAGAEHGAWRMETEGIVRIILIKLLFY